MAIEAYKVGISLILESNVTREMGNIARQFENLDRIIQGAQRSVNGLAAGLRGLSRIGESAAKSWTAAAQAMERAAKAATRAGQGIPNPGAAGGGADPAAPAGPRAQPVRTAAANSVAQYYLAQRTGDAIGGKLLSGGSGGGRGLVPYGGGGGGGGMPELNLRPGATAGGPGFGAMAEQLATFFAVRESMKEDVALRGALLSMGFKPEDPDFEAGIKRLRALASSSAYGTIFSEAQAGGGMPAAAGPLGFGGSDPASREEAMKKFETIYPTILRLGEVAEMQHMGSMEDAMVAAISYAHMTNRYDPKDLEPGLDRLLNVARLTHESVAGEQTTLKYSVPIGQAAGMKADDIAAITGFLQVLGFSGTTAGTGLGQLISGLAPISITEHGANAKAKALQALGVMDDKGKIKEDVAPGGHVDAMALLKHIADAAKQYDPIEMLKILREAFTVRGMRVAGAMENPEAIPRLLAYIDQLNRLPGARATQEALAQSPLQAFEQMIARFADVGNTLVTGTLPGLQKGFEGLTAVLTGVNQALKDHPAVATTGGYIAEALGIGFLFKSGKGLWSLLRGAASGAADAATGGVATAAEAAGGAGVLRTFGGLGLAIGIASAIAAGRDAAVDWLQDKIGGPGSADRIKKMQQEDGDKFWSLFFKSAHAAEPTALAAKPSSAGPGGDDIPTVTIKPSSSDTIAVKIADAIKAALVGVSVTLDGKKVGEMVANRLADQMSKPSSGTNGTDIRLSPWMPGVLGGAH